MADIQRIPNWNNESDVFIFLVELLEDNKSQAGRIFSKAWDMLAGGGKKKAFQTIQRDCMSFVKRSSDDLTEYIREEIPEITYEKPGFLKMAGKILAMGIVNDMASTPFRYKKYLSRQQQKEMEDASVERGKNKLKTMLDNKGIASEREAKELLDISREILGANAFSNKAVEEMEKMVDRNLHTEALIYLYEMLGLKEKVKALRHLNEAIKHIGHVPNEIKKVIDREFYEPAMKEVKRVYSPEEAEAIHMAF